MEITDAKYISSEEIIEKLRNVTMLKDNTNFVYKDAHISFIKINPLSLSPCQFYILKSALESKIALRHSIINCLGRDINNHPGGWEFTVAGEPAPRTIIPPIVEESLERDHRIYQLINDGMHRIYNALLMKDEIVIIYIRGASEPYYAYPLPNGWKDVKIVSEISSNVVKKIHRIEDNKKLYRNFDSVFINCSQPRGISNGR